MDMISHMNDRNPISVTHVADTRWVNFPSISSHFILPFSSFPPIIHKDQKLPSPEISEASPKRLITLTWFTKWVCFILHFPITPDNEEWGGGGWRQDEQEMYHTAEVTNVDDPVISKPNLTRSHSKTSQLWKIKKLGLDQQKSKH